jgi:DNA modification methylase/predicted RNA-binding Zn-ribbon protein involved in translation (DUF1610 family)
MPDQLHLPTPPAAPEPGAPEPTDREVYRQRLREALRDPAFRAIEGFPIGSDEAILVLSDPPTYTACPNPFLPEILQRWQEERRQLRAQRGLPPDDPPQEPPGLPRRPTYHREPFAADVSEGKNDPIYNAHSYHTKVPHRAIMRYILHYTDPGDIVLDGFCGTGMTGVAAQLCGDRQAVQSLGYQVQDDGTVLDEKGRPFSRLGPRRAVLIDLCPAATFIAYNYNTPVDPDAFEREARRILREVEEECGWMYETWHPHPPAETPPPLARSAGEGRGPGGEVRARINYTVWSDLFLCPQCGQEIVFWDVAVDRASGRVREEFPCPRCGALQTKRTLDRAWETVYDRALKAPVRRARQVPVLIHYTVGRRRYEKTPDAADLDLLRRIEESDIPYPFPTDPLPEGEKTRDPMNVGITHVHHFYTRRNLWTLAAMWQKLREAEPSLRHWLTFTFEQAILGMSRWARYVPKHYSQVNQGLSGTLYIASQVVEASPGYIIRGKIPRLAAVLRTSGLGSPVIVSTQSSHRLKSLPDNSVDYVFVDPPFGSNLMYSELNFLWEAWLGVFTHNGPEAVINKTQGKGLPEYQALMEACFREFYRVLKPGRWMTVEFHNSQNRVWNAIQEALQRAGFVVADVRTFDKQQGTFNQVTATGAVKQDLIISAYKPNERLEERVRALSRPGLASSESVWAFVDYHLNQLPVPELIDGKLEVLAERQDYLLYDRMVAFHVQRGIPVPIGAAEFYAGLRERYSERDGMFFLPLQAAEYDRRRLQAEAVVQLPLIVTDERSAIRWLRAQLQEQPRTLGELQPLFMREAQRAWAENETPLELRQLLEENFLEDEEGRWYVPDPNRARDLEEMREKLLLREFRRYAGERGTLRVFRKEAVMAGFRRAWREKDYETIVRVADRLPLRVLEEDPALLMYYDNARGKLEK